MGAAAGTADPTAALAGLAHLPRPVADRLTTRRAALLARAHGRTLDLCTEAARALVSDSIGGSPRSRSDRYDTVVSVCALAAFADLPAAVAGIAALLDHDGCLLAVEPVATPGPAGVIAASLWDGWAVRRGLNLSRDVPAALRAAGFTLTDVDRFEAPTLVAPLRRFAQIRARLFPEPALEEDS